MIFIRKHFKIYESKFSIYEKNWGMVMRRKKWIGLILSMVMILTMAACADTADEITLGDTSAEVMSETESEDVSETENDSVSEEEIQEAPSETEETDSENVSEEENSQAENASEEENISEAESIPEEESVSEEPEFTVQAHDAILFVKKAVNVRKGPSTDYEKIGGLSKGEQIQITGIADTGWYQIQYNGTEAYVASSYLIDETSYQAMIAEEEAAALAAQQAAQEQAAAEQAAQEQEAAEQAAQQQQAQANTGDYRAQVVAIMNQERADNGVGGITQSSTLDALAQIRAQEIVQSFSHTRPNGTSCFTVFEENGVTYMTAGENIAAGYGTPEAVMQGWMDSEGHRANILNGSFGQVGIGYYTDPNSTYGTYWVQIFSN